MMKKDLAQFAQKQYGQNFLQSDAVIQQIIQAMPDDERRVVEIGPGLGDLTKELVRVRNVTAFEVDKRLCEHLSRSFDRSLEEGRLELRCGDVLERWEEESLLDEPYHLVANLPYYIATRIILKALKDPQCRSALVMVQKEVAEKFAASVGEKQFSALSVLAQTAGRATIRFEVEPEAFVPAPKVVSAVLSLEKSRSWNDETFEQLLKIAFQQPRKKLSKNLTAVFPRERVAHLFETLDIDPGLRPHEVETSIYHHLYHELKKDILDGQQSTRQRKQKSNSKRQTQ
jgi:16S rRNA (adenine1518-N6/adenine1519-N6)-dimethyltransferase